MQSMFEVRRENLRILVRDKFEGNRAALSRAAGVHPNHINLILSDNPEHGRNMGETFARKLEVSLGLPVGYMDHPHSADDGVADVVSKALPPEFASVLRPDDQIAIARMHAGFVRALAPRVTDINGLLLCKVSTHDLDPAVAFDSVCIVDPGVKAVSGDGVYVLQKGGGVFLRRVTSKMSGGWDIVGGGETMAVDSLKGIKALARLVVLITTRVI